MKKSAIQLLILLGGCFVLLSPQAEPLGENSLRDLYRKIRPILDNPTPENPFYLQATHQEGGESGEAALYIPQRVDKLAEALSKVQNWCDILPLHINVKACTYREDDNTLTLYMGRKHYQKPGDAFELTYTLETAQTKGYFNAIATAAEGPLNTSDYRIELEFLDVEGKTFGRIFVANKVSWLSEKAMDAYLATLGKDKLGIKVVDHNSSGQPVHSRGAVAVAERNLVRYYFAFTAYFHGQSQPNPEQRYEQQLQDWFEHTEKFPQLYEMSRQEYLGAKRRERQNQLALQHKLDHRG